MSDTSVEVAWWWPRRRAVITSPPRARAISSTVGAPAGGPGAGSGPEVQATVIRTATIAKDVARHNSGGMLHDPSRDLGRE
jgi:hypothetical protein